MPRHPGRARRSRLLRAAVRQTAGDPAAADSVTAAPPGPRPGRAAGPQAGFSRPAHACTIEHAVGAGSHHPHRRRPRPAGSIGPPFFHGHHRGTMRVVLAEKPSVARELAAFLGAGARRDGYLEGNGYQVTWALGHLGTLKEPEDYDPALKKWSLATLPIVPDRFELKLLDEKRARDQFAVIKRLFRAADEIDLRHGRRPRGRADLPLHPGTDRGGRQARPAAVAQLPDRRPRSATPSAACGRWPTTTRCTTRPAAAARPTGSSASTRRATTPSATATPGASSGASAGCRRRCWR